MWAHVSFFINEASEEQAALIFHLVWGKSTLLNVTWRSPVFSQHTVAFLILVKLEPVMVWGGGVTETRPELLQLYAQKLIFDSESSSPSNLLDPICQHRDWTTYPWSATFHFECFLPDTIHVLPASCIVADTVTASWCTQWCEKFCIQ